MMIKIALRNVFRQKRRSILTGLTILAGFVLSSFTISWSDGSYSDVIEMFTNTKLGQIQIHNREYIDKPIIFNYIENQEEVVKKLNEVDEIKSFTLRLNAGGLATVTEKTAAISITGIYPEMENKTTGFNVRVKKGKPLSKVEKREVVIGKGLGKLINGKINDELVIVTQGADGSIANDKYKIVGIYDSGDKVADRMNVFMHIVDLQELLVLDNKVHEIAITINNIGKSRKVAKKIKTLLNNNDLVVEPWQVFASSFYNAMQADRKGMWIMLFIIVLVVAIGVFNTVLMSVLERQREYGVLLALGTKPVDLIKMILNEVFFLSLFSVIIASIIAFFINYYLSINGIEIPEPITYGGVEFKVMRTMINLQSFLIPGITVFFTAILVAFIPAFKASKTKPAKTMRKN